MDTVGFVILHYKDRKITDACVRSILKMREQNRIQIIIVDNDIDKPEQERLDFAAHYKKNPRITVLTVRKNGGFSHANNLGFAYACKKMRASYVVIANNDVLFPQPDFVARLEKSFKKHPGYVLGPDILCERTGEHQNPLDTRLRTAGEARDTVRMNRLALQVFPLVWPLLCVKFRNDEKRRLRGKKDAPGFYQKVQKNIVPFGACLIFTPSFIRSREPAFFPETSFFYEEYILACRCRKNGWPIFYDPSLRVLHENGVSTKKTYKSEKNRLRFMLEKTAGSAEIYLKMVTGG